MQSALMKSSFNADYRASPHNSTSTFKHTHDQYTHSGQELSYFTPENEKLYSETPSALSSDSD